MGNHRTLLTSWNVSQGPNLLVLAVRALDGLTYDLSMAELRNSIASGAAHNSAERCDAPKCHPETRVAVQGEMISWAAHGGQGVEEKKMMWVTGPAGTGKTAILGSVAETCQKQGLLAASFFFSSFSGSERRRSKRYLVATLAYQLLQRDSLQDIHGSILTAIKRNPAIFEDRLADQLEQLILGPFRAAAELSLDTSLWPKVILIDGLDECDTVTQVGVHPTRPALRTKEDEQTEILDVLEAAVADPAFPFRIIVVSRPERVIRAFFESAANLATHIFLDNKYNPDDDIRLFTKSKLAAIRNRYGLDPSWVTEDNVQTLEKNASGQFVYVATVMRFIERTPGPPQELLACVLALRRYDKLNPFAPLDALYTHVLKSSPNPILAVKWICLVALDPCRCQLHLSTGSSENFLGSFKGETEYLWGNLHSLISDPPSDPDQEPYTFYHKSFLDFLDDPERCGGLYFDRDGRFDFFADRYWRVTQTQGPVIPLSHPEQEVFVKHYASLDHITQATFSNEQKDYQKWKTILLSSDLAWWTKLHLRLRSRSRGRSVLMDTIRWIHASCPWYRCRRVCKHLRSIIFEMGQDLGYWSASPKDMQPWIRELHKEITQSS